MVLGMKEVMLYGVTKIEKNNQWPWGENETCPLFKELFYSCYLYTIKTPHLLK